MSALNFASTVVFATVSVNEATYIYTLFSAAFSTSTYIEKHLVVEVAEAMVLIYIEDGGVTCCGVLKTPPFFF